MTGADVELVLARFVELADQLAQSAADTRARATSPEDRYGRGLADGADDASASIRELVAKLRAQRVTRTSSPTTAATYAARGIEGCYGVDIIRQTVETDELGQESYRDVASWSWHPAPDAATWGKGDADRLLWALGWVRVSPWAAEPDLAGMPGWVCEIRPDTGRRARAEDVLAVLVEGHDVEDVRAVWTSFVDASGPIPEDADGHQLLTPGDVDVLHRALTDTPQDATTAR